MDNIKPLFLISFTNNDHIVLLTHHRSITNQALRALRDVALLFLYHFTSKFGQ
jgi:hypothetical protein